MKSALGNKEVMAENLKYYMNINKKTRKDICNELDFPYSTFTDWCNGNKYPRIDKIEMLANYFGIEKSDLIEERKEENNIFKQLRIDNNLTQEELAKELHISITELKEYENGKQVPLQTLIKFASLFNVSLDELKGINMYKQGTTAFVSTSKREVELHERWAKEVGYIDYTDKEHDLVILVAQFIKSIRGGDDYEDKLNMAYMFINQLKK